MPKSAVKTQDKYADIAQALQQTLENRPNYQDTADLQRAIDELFSDSPCTTMPLAPWHWDYEQSNHVVETPLLYPNGRKIPVAVVAHVHRDGLLVQAYFKASMAKTPTDQDKELVDDVTAQLGTEYHLLEVPGEERSHIVFTIAKDTSEIVDAVDRVARTVATITGTP